MRPGDFEHLIVLWDDGSRRIAAAGPVRRLQLQVVVDALVLELRRRLGGRFTTDELARYFLDEGTDWCFQIACRTAPAEPEAWDMPTVAGAAFARYARAAADYGGGAAYYEG